jgi:hypothetical protein
VPIDDKRVISSIKRSIVEEEEKQQQKKMPLEGMVTHSQFQAPGAGSGSGSGSGSGRDEEVIKTKIRDTSIISSLDLEHMLTMKGKGEGDGG